MLENAANGGICASRVECEHIRFVAKLLCVEMLLHVRNLTPIMGKHAERVVKRAKRNKTVRFTQETR